MGEVFGMVSISHCNAGCFSVARLLFFSRPSIFPVRLHFNFILCVIKF